MLTRREVLQRIGAGALASSVPTLSLASADTESRLVLVILRGAMDGLALAPPYGEARYAALRGELALPPGGSEGVFKLDGLFALHPAFARVHELFENGEASVVHAAASPYRERSHFDGQDVLENGTHNASDRRDGWLNRAIATLGGSLGEEAAIAISQNTPLVLRGDSSVTSWAPSALPDADHDTLDRLADLYARDEFFSKRLTQALESQAIAGDIGQMGNGRRRGNEAQQFKATMQHAAKFISADGGPRIAVIESGGWDTHANQGSTSGQLASRFAGLDQGIGALRDQLGALWTNTAVVVVTEFGRTVQVNGTRGTDHGTASAALLLGGAVNGGHVVADWPGLATKNLYQGRDLCPTADLRSIFKAVLIEHLGVDHAFIERDVFPHSADARPMENLFS